MKEKKNKKKTLHFIKLIKLLLINCSNNNFVIPLHIREKIIGASITTVRIKKKKKKGIINEILNYNFHAHE